MWLVQVPESTAAEVVHAVVQSVYDGDTLTLSDGTKVRLAFVNTTELRPGEAWSAEARDAAAALVLGREVDIVGDGVRDRYGRLVASVRVGNVDLAERLVQLGLAHVFVVPPETANVGTLLGLQQVARSAGLGLWSSIQGPLHVTSFHADGGRDGTDANAEYFRLCNVSATPVDLRGWVVGDPAGRSFALPPVQLPPGFAVAVHSGVGRDDVAAGRIYLGSPLAIWPDEGARLLIKDPSGVERASRTP